MRILTDGLRNALGPLGAAYALAAVGLNLQFGYTGLANYGQIGFVLVGAYGTAIGVAEVGLPLGLAMLLGIGCAVALGLLLGVPTLRLRGDYLAIVTISAAEILRISVNAQQSQDLTGGPQGISDFAGGFRDLNPIPEGRYGIGDVSWDHRTLWVMIVAWALVAVCSFVVWRLMHSPWGRVVKAIREDEDAARALGKNAVGYKLQSLVLGGVFGSLAGMMLVFDKNFVEPRQFESQLTQFFYALLILGGIARVAGPIIGSILFWAFIVGFQSFLDQAVSNDFLGIANVLDKSDVGPARFAAVGLLLILLVVFRPQGVVGDRREAMLDE